MNLKEETSDLVTFLTGAAIVIIAFLALVTVFAVIGWAAASFIAWEFLALYSYESMRGFLFTLILVIYIGSSQR